MPHVADHDIDWRELADYLSGRMTEAERDAYECRLARSPEQTRLVQQMARVWERARHVVPSRQPVDARRAWDELHVTLSQADRRRDLMRGAFESGWLATTRARVRTAVFAVIGVAAAAIVGVALVRMLRSPALVGTPPIMRELATTAGGHSTIRLSDGTRVVLGPMSRMHWPGSFGDQSREVWLDGEAYFDVALDPRHPFRVHVAHAVVQDLGTAFVVRDYADDRQVLVAVKQGVVSLGPSTTAPMNESVVLRAGDLGTMSPPGQPTVRHNVDVNGFLAFTTGRVVFVNTPLSAVANELERWYGVRVTISDSSLAHAVVSAQFRVGRLRTTLDALAEALNARYTRTADSIAFRPAR